MQTVVARRGEQKDALLYKGKGELIPGGERREGKFDVRRPVFPVLKEPSEDLGMSGRQREMNAAEYSRTEADSNEVSRD